MSFKAPEKYRLKEGPMGSDESYGINGVFVIPIHIDCQIRCIASDGAGWEHVSISEMVNIKKKRPLVRTPSWNIMCKVKNLFWDEEDCVIQFHPPKSEYVNRHPNVLHLWRKIGVKIETPPKILIG